MEFFNSGFFAIIFVVIVTLLIIALAAVIFTMSEISSFIQYHKEYMVNSQLYISEARDITYKTRDIIKAMRDKHFGDFCKYHHEKRGGDLI